MNNSKIKKDLDLLGEYDEFDLVDVADSEVGAWGWAAITASSWVCGAIYVVVGPTTACSSQCR